MTECERLIKEGFLPAEFLEPESRECEVPTELKKLWAIQIDLINQVKEICERHQLKFFAIFGTALGAVRHHGFIPWDDDVDLGLLREDYNAFCKYAAEELEYPYFLQLPTTDKAFYSSHVFLRNSNATCIVRGDGGLTVNNGALIHIMPIDGYPGPEIHKLVKKLRWKNNVAYSNYHYKGRTNKKAMRLLLKAAGPVLLGGSRLSFFQRREKIWTEISAKECDKVGLHSTINSKITHLVHDRHIFDDVEWIPFEYSTVPVPARWEEYLTNTYGDYRKLPAEEKRIYKHSWETDCDTPYKEYCAKKYGVKYKD